MFNFNITALPMRRFHNTGRLTSTKTIRSIAPIEDQIIQEFVAIEAHKILDDELSIVLAKQRIADLKLTLRSARKNLRP
jgi:hypothetical protein